VTINQNNDSSRFGHDRCLLCGSGNPLSLKLSFREDGEFVTAQLRSPDYLQGYHGILHGGVISALLDAAMAHCLFHKNIQAVTAELNVRFLHPVSCGSHLELRAWLKSSRPPLFNVSSQLICQGQLAAKAEAKFLVERT